MLSRGEQKGSVNFCQHQESFPSQDENTGFTEGKGGATNSPIFQQYCVLLIVILSVLGSPRVKPTVRFLRVVLSQVLGPS